MRPTYVTAYVLSTDPSDEHEPARRVTFRKTDDGTFEPQTVKGTHIGDPWEYQYMGRTRFERLQAALIRADGRRTEAAVGMFTVERRHLVKTNGKLAGQWSDLPTFALSLLEKSAEDYRGETYEDRAADFEAIITQENWD